MQYRHEIGARSRYARPCVGRDCIHWYSTLRSSIGMKSSTLPLTSPCSGTKRKTTVPLFFASTGGLRLLSFIPILLLSLQFIDFYSPSLRWFASTDGLRLPSFIPILLLSLQLIDFYSPSLRWLSANISKLRLPLLQTHTASVASVYWFLQFFLPLILASRAGSDCPSYRPILHQSLDSVDCLVLLTPLCQIATYIYQ